MAHVGGQFNYSLLRSAPYLLSTYLTAVPKINTIDTGRRFVQPRLTVEVTNSTRQKADAHIFARAVAYFQSPADRANTLVIITNDSRLATDICLKRNDLRSTTRLHIIMYGVAITMKTRPLTPIARLLDRASRRDVLEVQGIKDSFVSADKFIGVAPATVKLHDSLKSYNCGSFTAYIDPLTQTLIAIKNEEILFYSEHHADFKADDSEVKRDVSIAHAVVPLQRSDRNEWDDDALRNLNSGLAASRSFKSFISAKRRAHAFDFGDSARASTLRNALLSKILLIPKIRYESNRQHRRLGTVLCDMDSITYMHEDTTTVASALRGRPSQKFISRPHRTATPEFKTDSEERKAARRKRFKSASCGFIDLADPAYNALIASKA